MLVGYILCFVSVGNSGMSFCVCSVVQRELWKKRFEMKTEIQGVYAIIIIIINVIINVII